MSVLNNISKEELFSRTFNPWLEQATIVGKPSLLMMLENHNGERETEEGRHTNIGKQISILQSICDKFQTPVERTKICVCSEFDEITSEYLNILKSKEFNIRPYILYIKDFCAKNNISFENSSLTAGKRHVSLGDSQKDDEIYLSEISERIKRYNIVIFIVGVGHLPGLFNIDLKIESSLIRNTNFTLINTCSLSKVQSFVSSIQIKNPEKFYQRSAPTYIDIEAASLGKAVEESIPIGEENNERLAEYISKIESDWQKYHGPGSSPHNLLRPGGGGAGGGGGAPPSIISKQASIKEIKALMNKKGISYTGFFEKSEFINALRGAGVTVTERSRKSRRQKRKTRKN